MVRKSSPLRNEGVKKRMENVEGISYVSLWMAVIFLSVYVIFCISDDLYNESDTTTRSKGFLFNVLALVTAIGLVMAVYYNPSEAGNGFYLKLLLSAGLLTFVGVAAHELRHNLDASANGKDKEEASQFILSVIGLVFALIGGLAIFLNVAMRKYL